MLELLHRLFIGHAHKWEIINEISGRYTDDFGGSGPYTRYTLRCTECGAIKKKMIR
jgi:hypothetical protein